MTALVTTSVLTQFSNPDGTPLVGAKVTATLTSKEVDGGVVVPSNLSGITDSSGNCTLSLWPNSRGVAGSKYNLSVVAAKCSTPLWTGVIVVPEVDGSVDAHTLLQVSASPTLDAAQIAVLQAQEYAAQASASAIAAAESAALGGGGSGGVDIASVKDASNGIAGLTLFKINLFNALGTIKSFITTLATAPRTYTFPDKDITVAGLSDITGTNSGTNTGDETATTIKTKLGITTISGDNTGDESSASIKTKLGITTISGDNTGDESAASIKSKLGITTLSGSNTGDETTATIKTKLGVTTLSGSNTGDQTLTSLGIPNVENKSSADIRSEITSGNVTTALGYTPVTPTTLNTHTTDTNNPHSTTKAQLGLSAVDNTSDANKPVSTLQQAAIDAKMTNPMTTAGDVIIGGASGAPTRLPIGSNGYVYTVVSGAPAWAAATGGTGGDFLASLLNTEVSVTGATTLTSSAFGKMHVCSGTSADYTVGLPAVLGNAGKFIGFRMSSALTVLVTLDGNASEAIDGSLTRVMWTNEVAILYCDGTSWTKIGGKSIPMYATIRLAGGTPASAQSIANATATKVLCTQSDASVAGMADTTNKRINIKRSGTYAVSGLVYVNSGFIYNRAISSLMKNSSEIFSGEANCSSNQSYPWCQAEGRPVLAVGDYIELYAYQVNSAASSSFLYGGATGASNILSVMEIPSW